MGFEETFTAYLDGDEEKDLNMSCHFDYKKLKSDLNFCRDDKHHEAATDSHGDRTSGDDLNQIVPHQSCHRCDRIFSELINESTKMADYFTSRVRQLVHLHFTPGFQRFLCWLFQCFKDDHEALVQKGLMLIQFVVINAIALRKILKKYDKVHESTMGTNFKSKLQAKHLDIMQSPWLIELIALYVNLNGYDSLTSDELFGQLSYDLNISDEDSVLTLTLLNSEKLEYSLTCPICLDIVFQPYALRCGHIFCKSCACLAAGLLIIEGFRCARTESKCPVCRESGVYAKSVCMSELGLLLQRRKVRFAVRVIDLVLCLTIGTDFSNSRLIGFDQRPQVINRKFRVIEDCLHMLQKLTRKVHESTMGTNFKSKLQAKHLDIMQSPWLIELIALYMNLNGSDSLTSDELFGQLSYDLNISDEDSVLTLTLLNSEKLEYSLTCPICLDIVFQPYALRCGHIFCKSCACLAAGLLIIEGFRCARTESKCPVCRESGVYAKSVCMSELGLLLQRRYKDGFKKRLMEEREKILTQTKEYWELQTSYVMGL